MNKNKKMKQEVNLPEIIKWKDIKKQSVGDIVIAEDHEPYEIVALPETKDSHFGVDKIVHLKRMNPMSKQKIYPMFYRIVGEFECVKNVF